jgi:hypothetical protein
MQPFNVPKNPNLGAQKGKPGPTSRIPGPQGRTTVPRANPPGFTPGGKPNMSMPFGGNSAKSDPEEQDSKFQNEVQPENQVEEQKPETVEKEVPQPTHERKFSFSPGQDTKGEDPKHRKEDHVEIGSNNEEDKDENPEPLIQL